MMLYYKVFASISTLFKRLADWAFWPCSMHYRLHSRCRHFGFKSRLGWLGPNANGTCIACLSKFEAWLNTLERMRNPVWQAFSYWIWHVSIVIQWTVTHSSMNHNEHMPYPVWKSSCTGFCILSIEPLDLAHCTINYIHAVAILSSTPGLGAFRHNCPSHSTLVWNLKYGHWRTVSALTTLALL